MAWQPAQLTKKYNYILLLVYTPKDEGGQGGEVLSLRHRGESGSSVGAVNVPARLHSYPRKARFLLLDARVQFRGNTGGCVAPILQQNQHALLAS